MVGPDVSRPFAAGVAPTNLWCTRGLRGSRKDNFTLSAGPCGAAMCQTFVSHGLCVREQTDAGTVLVFPSYFNREQSDLAAHPPPLLTYRVTGALDEIYATLVVRLHYIQIRSWDEYLHSIDAFGAEVLTIKNEANAAYWAEQADAVMLIIRTVAGEIRWMDVSTYFRRERSDDRRLAKEIVFEGEQLTALNLLRMRDRVLGPPNL